jgi:hypothetical protein
MNGATEMAAWEIWVRGTELHAFVLAHPRLWQVLETLHYFGLCLLFGTVILFDLRILGVAKAIAPCELHRFVPWGVAGFLLNLVTGICFFFGYPEQYAYNSAFHIKVVAMALAGINVALFYGLVFPRVKGLGPHTDAPTTAKVVTGVSLASWVVVLSAGRLLTFFRPPFFH